MCVSTPRLKVTSGVIWILYNWLKIPIAFQLRLVALVIDIMHGHDPSGAMLPQLHA